MSGMLPVSDHLSHAGPFIWIDLSTHLSSPSVEAERELAWKMIENKVWLATGEAYRSERPGWFRITFAVDKAELELGIERLVIATIVRSYRADQFVCRVMKSLKRS